MAFSSVAKKKTIYFNNTVNIVVVVVVAANCLTVQYLMINNDAKLP